MQDRLTDLPFKVGDRSIVIIRDLPVTQCPHCEEYALPHGVMERVERILAATEETTELEIVRYAA